MLLFKFFNLITSFLIRPCKNRKKPGNRIGIARLFLGSEEFRCGVWQVIPPARRHSEGGRFPCGFHT